MPVNSIKTDQVNLITIDDSHHGQRIDNFLLSALKGAPRSLIYRLLRKGEVRVNKKRVKPEVRLNEGDVVRIAPVRLRPEQTGEPVTLNPKQVETLNSSIIYEDEHYIAINKPSGLAVHGGSGIRLGLIEQLRLARPDDRFLELVHRLDRDTSGVILVARKRQALVEVQKLFKGTKSIDKRYMALVHGIWPEYCDRADFPLKKNELHGGERIVVVDPEGKESLTKFKVLGQSDRYALIEARPVTGRTHQIRVHCKGVGHGIAGDPKYRNKVEEDSDKKSGIKRLCLHAWQLAFVHPFTGELLKLTALPSGIMLNYIEKEGISIEV